VRTALLVALLTDAVMWTWSFIGFVPKAVAFEKADPSSTRPMRSGIVADEA
jgi:hypothetical protein